MDDNCDPKICLINETQQTLNTAQHKELNHPPATGSVFLFNSSILMFNQKDNRITVSKVAVKRAPMMNSSPIMWLLKLSWILVHNPVLLVTPEQEI